MFELLYINTFIQCKNYTLCIDKSEKLENSFKVPVIIGMLLVFPFTPNPLY